MGSKVPAEQRKPIYCSLLWNSFYFEPDGTLYPCCESKESLGPLRDLSVDQIMNQAKLEEMRTEMLAGQFPKSCETCRVQEEAGALSHRLRTNEVLGFRENNPPEASRVHLDRPKLRFLDLRFSNLCNFACRFCSGDYSSRMAQETLEIWGHQDPRGVLRRASFPLSRLDEVDLSELKLVNLAGGEPLLMVETYQLLKYLAERKITDLKIHIVTNLSQLELADQKLLPLLEPFRAVTFSASLDGIRERFEYMRYGGSWLQTSENLARLTQFVSAEGSSSKRTLQGFMSVYLLNALNFLSDLHEMEKAFALPIYLNLSTSPHFSRVDYLPKSIKAEILRHYEGQQDPRLDQFLNFMLGQNLDDQTAWSHFDRYMMNTKSFDQKRGQHLFKAFPAWRGVLRRALSQDRHRLHEYCESHLFAGEL